jgi:hypothetical protein
MVVQPQLYADRAPNECRHHNDERHLLTPWLSLAKRERKQGIHGGQTQGTQQRRAE